MNRLFPGGRCALLAGAIGVWLLAAAGCGPSGPAVGEVTGKVTYKGKPVPGGVITYNWRGGENAFPGALAEDGSYTIPKVFVGECIITVATVPPGGLNFLRKNSKKTTAPLIGEGKYVKIPDKYQDKLKSGIKKDVVKGKNTIDIDLTD